MIVGQGRDPVPYIAKGFPVSDALRDLVLLVLFKKT